MPSEKKPEKVDVNAEIQAAIQAALAGGGNVSPLLGGVPEGIPVLGADGKPSTSDQYRDGAQDLPLGWTMERRGRLQRQLAEIGLLRGSYNSRLWGPDSAQAYAAVLATANRLGVDADAAIDLLRADDSLRSEVLGDESKVEPYLKPDPMSVAKQVKTIFDDLLGRDVTTEELPDLVAQYTALDRKAYDVGVQATEGQSVEAVDPAAQFEALITDRYRPEINMNRGREEAANSREGVLAGVNSLDTLLGIGGIS